VVLASSLYVDSSFHKRKPYDIYVFVLEREVASMFTCVAQQVHGQQSPSFPRQGGRRGRMVVGFTTTYAISAYHH
jgi:hypothetical protein